MPPYQPNNLSQPPANNPNPYGFITDPAKPPKTPMFGGSMKSRIILVVAGLIVVFILGLIINTLLSASSNKSNQVLKNAVAEQQEIIRISEMGMKDALTPDTKGYATTVNFVTKTSQKNLQERLGKQKIKMNKQDFASKTNTKTDELLKSASASNSYDEAMNSTLDKLLEQHMKTLQTAYDMSGSTKTKEVLKKDFESTKILANHQKN